MREELDIKIEKNLQLTVSDQLTISNTTILRISKPDTVLLVLIRLAPPYNMAIRDGSMAKQKW